MITIDLLRDGNVVAYLRISLSAKGLLTGTVTTAMYNLRGEPMSFSFEPRFDDIRIRREDAE